MDAHRVKIFYRADDNALIFVVAHDFHFVFFPSKKTLLDQHLSCGRHIEAVLYHLFIFFAIVSDTASGTTKRETGANNDWKVTNQIVCSFECSCQSCYSR